MYRPGPQLKICTLEQFEGGNGNAARDQAALTAAAAAINAGTFNALELGAKSYSFSAGATFTVPCVIFGQGDQTVVNITANVTGFLIHAEDCTVADLQMVGTGAGAAQYGVASTDLNGGVGANRLRIRDCTFKNFGAVGSLSAGVFLFNPPAGILHGPQISNCRFDTCSIGVWCLTEYSVISDCQFFFCDTGIRVQAGNVDIVGGVVTSCTTNGIYITSGGNDGHGVVSGVEINHNTVNVLVDPAVHNGMPFVGCNIYGAATAITVGAGTVGIRFQDCAIDLSAINIGANSRVVFADCLWPQQIAPLTLTIDITAIVQWNSCVDLNGDFPAFIGPAFITAPTQLNIDGAVVPQGVTAAGGAAVVVDSFLTLPNGVGAKLDIVWSAFDATGNVVTGGNGVANIRAAGGVLTIAGQFFSGVHGDAALAASTLVLGVSGAQHLTVAFTPPMGYANGLQWTASIVATQAPLG